VSRRLAPVFLASLLLLTAASSASAALPPGALDTTFSSDGLTTTNFTSGFDSANAVAVQIDSKIVAVGQAGGSGGRFAVARYQSTGPLDPGFSVDGKLTTDFTAGYDAAFDGALDADGNIVAVGRAGGRGGRFAIARYLPDGSLDPSFSTDGKAIANFTPGDDYAFGVAIQADDGKIVAVGRAGGSGGVFAAARFNTDGTLDTSFSTDGKATTNFTAGDDRADAVAVQADDGIVVAGSANYFGSNGKFALVRYKADGTLDTGFSGDGKLTTDFTPGFDGGFAVAVQPGDQYIVAAGQAGLTLGLVRYKTNGTLDTAFSTDGKATTNFTRGADYADDVVIQNDGKIVVAGAANFFGPDAKFALARYNGVDGALDPGFSGDGKVMTNLTTGFDGAYGVAIAPTGEIVAGGYAGGNGGRFAVVRYVG
jgi:uncharacterized delta-60 repeat protein